jgi:hypothetical protein
MIQYPKSPYVENMRAFFECFGNNKPKNNKKDKT